MFVLYANKNRLTVRQREPITSGSVNVYLARFEFSDDWQGLTQKVVFRGSGETINTMLNNNGYCNIPWEVLKAYGGNLEVGVYGTQDNTALPTVWADLGPILEGVSLGGGVYPPTPALWEQELAKKGDSLYYDGLNLSLMSGDNTLSTVAVAGGGGEGIVYEFGHGLKQEGLKVSVDMANKDNPDRTLPVSAAAMDCVVGNIEILLKTI